MVKSKFVAEIAIEYDIDTGVTNPKEENAIASAFRRLVDDGVMLQDLKSAVEREFCSKDEIKQTITAEQKSGEVWVEEVKKNG